MSDAKEIAEAVVSALEENRNIDHDTHNRHHDYIKLKIEREIKRVEILDQIKLHLMKYGAAALVSVVFFATWTYFKISLHS